MEDQLSINLCMLAHVAFLKSNNIEITEQVKCRIKKRFTDMTDESLSSIGSGKNSIGALRLIFTITDYKKTDIPRRKRSPLKKRKRTMMTTTIAVWVSLPKDEPSIFVEGPNPPPPAMPERLRDCEHNIPSSSSSRDHEITNEEIHDNDKGKRRLDEPSSSSSPCDHDEIKNDANHDNDNNDDMIAVKKRKERRAVIRDDEGKRILSDGPEPPPEMPEWLRRLIADKYGGSGERLIIQKTLHESDLKRNQNRLSMPFNQVRQNHEFLNDDEWSDVDRRDDKGKFVGVRATVIGASDSEVREIAMDFKMWDLKKSSSYILTKRWYDFATLNQLRTKQLIQVWFFRDRHQKPCFAIVNLHADKNPNPDTTASTSTCTADK